MAFPSTDFHFGGKQTAQATDVVLLSTHARILSYGVNVCAAAGNSANIYVGFTTGVLPSTTDVASGRQLSPGASAVCLTADSAGRAQGRPGRRTCVRSDSGGRLF